MARNLSIEEAIEMEEGDNKQEILTSEFIYSDINEDFPVDLLGEADDGLYGCFEDIVRDSLVEYDDMNCGKVQGIDRVLWDRHEDDVA